MRLLEYEAKSLLAANNLKIPLSTRIKTGEPIDSQHFVLPVVIKSQVPVGGRGKAGGVIVVSHQPDVAPTIEHLFALPIKGYVPQALLVEEKLSIAHEYYLALLINRELSDIQLVAHSNGGVEVENNDIAFFKQKVSIETIDELSQQVAALFGENDAADLRSLIKQLYEAFIKNDALLIEINPLVKTTDGRYICADAKIELDDAASFRHRDWQFEDKPAEVNFVTLDAEGEIATIANGAGLAMATVDAVAAHGMRPANFLDVGGGANTESVLRAFTKIMEYRHIKAIVINIFAGITRCDEVARAIIAARQHIADLPPLYIRLAGTNYAAAAELLAAEQIATLPTLEQCLAAAKGAAS